MKNVPIIAKFLSILGLFGMFATLAAVVATGEMRSVAAGFERVTRTSIAAAQMMTLADLDIANMTGNFTTIADAASAADLRNGASGSLRDQKAFDQHMAEAARLLSSDAENILALKRDGDSLINAACAGPMQAAVIAITAQAYVNAQLNIAKNCTPSFPSVISELNAARQKMQGEAVTDMAALQHRTGNAILITFSLIFSGIFLVTAVGFFAIRASVLMPMQALQNAMEKLAGGELGVEISGTDRRDEIGGMALATQIFKDSALEKQRLEREAKLTEEKLERERERTDAARAAALEQQSFVVNSLGQGLEKLSKGELLFRLTADFASEYEKLRSDFNDAMQKLQDTVTSIASNIRDGFGLGALGGTRGRTSST